MTDHASPEEAVLELNRRTFKAEDEPETAREILGDALSEDFSIVRAIGAVEGKEAMIERVATDTSKKTRRIEHAATLARRGADPRGRVQRPEGIEPVPHCRDLGDERSELRRRLLERERTVG